MAKKSHRILIVGNESIVSRELEIILTELGYTVCGSVSLGEHVLDEVKEKEPDIVLMDITREQDTLLGIDIAKKLNTFTDMPIIYLSAEANKEMLENTKMSNTYGFLTKPLKEGTLYTVIEVANDKYSLQSELRRKHLELGKKNSELTQALKEITRSKELIEEGRRKFQNIFESMEDIAIVYKLDLTILEVNESAIRKLGYTREELLKMNLMDIMSDDFKEKCSLLRQVLLKNKKNYFSSVLIKKNGEEIHLETNVDLIENIGHTTVLSISRDITQLEAAKMEIIETNKKLEISLDVSQMAWWEYCVNTNSLSLGKSSTFFARENDGKKNDISLEEWESIIHPEDKEKALNALNDYLTVKKDYYDVNYRIRLVDGKWYWINSKGIVSQKNEKGEPKKIIGVIRNINKSKLKEIKLTGSKKLLDEMGRLAKIGAWEYDIKTSKVLWTDQVYDILELERENSTLELEETLRFYHEDDRDSIKKIVRIAILEGKPFNIMMKLITNKGKNIATIINGVGEKHNEVVTKVRGTIQDITNKIVSNI